MRVLLTDCETTGLSSKDEPIEVALLLVSQREGSTEYVVEDSYTGRQEPAVPIHPRAQAVHGLSIADLRGTSFDRARIGELLNRSDVLVAHNASFDARMLAKVDPQFLRKPWRCSLRQGSWSSEIGGRSLDAICDHYGVTRDKAHSAPSDAAALLECLNRNTGKTARSRRHLEALLAKPAHVLQTERDGQRERQRDRDPLTITIRLDTGARSNAEDQGRPSVQPQRAPSSQATKVAVLLGVVALLGYCMLA